MRTRKSKIASHVLELVKKFFDGPTYRNQPAKVREYVKWALGYGGPAYYETPVPMTCTLERDDPDYPVSPS
jgi:hypothetical protein